MKISVNFLKDFVKLTPPFERVAEKLTMAGLEVKKVEPVTTGKDFVFEIEITSNRPDWLSHLGVAREIAAVEGLSLKMPDLPASDKRSFPAGWKLDLKEKEGCPYYSGVLIEGINWAPTPDFMKERLQACGLRSINLIVDITNYVLLEIGQPLHAFDADLLKGKEIQIRRVKAGESFTAIDQSLLTLLASDLVIADHDRPVALAGVMGGANSEVSEKTRNIFLESAFFNPRWVRQTSRRLGLTSESSYRFERRVDPQGVDLGRERAIYLIQKYAKPRFIGGVLKAGSKPVVSQGRVHLKAEEIQKVLGVSVKPREVISILTRLGLEVKSTSADAWNVGIPSFRSDLTRSIDLIEEIARIHGYDKLPESLPERQPPTVLSRHSQLKLQNKAREFFTGAGLFETVTFSLISETGLDPDKDLSDAVTIVNPMNKELTRMRPVMIPSLLQVVKKNVSQGAKRVPIFEIANIYRRDGNKSTQEEGVLAIAFYGDVRVKNWLDPQRKSTFYDLKGLVESFLNNLGIRGFRFNSSRHSLLNDTGSESICLNSEDIGFLGTVHPRLLKLWDLESEVHFAQVSLKKLHPHVLWQRVFHDLPRFPSMERDLSLLVQESVKAGEIQEEIERLGEGLVQKIELFDLFRGGRVKPGHKNVAFRVTYQFHERTLVSEEIQKLHTKIADELVKKFQAAFQATS
ncbi:MAG: phenylalanine--tRNA ligase subunit beta [Candidatus Omnitrophica bacterium]|nr:phenylalanine--tRNA ligase subunit beta [Candidatus Omnitrophota bacterium]